MTEFETLDLRAGEWIEVRSAAEVLATLDENGALDGLPFMPEMLAYCGQRHQVFRRADKTCDTVHWTGLRRMERTVHLKMLRCDGSGHGGCQAGCLMFWKEAWLRRVDDDRQPNISVDGRHALKGAGRADRERAWLKSTAYRSEPIESDVQYRCQATELYKASRQLPWWEPRQYVRDVCLNNLSYWEVARSIVIAAYSKLRRMLTGRSFPNVAGSLRRTPSESLGLQSGEWVIVKSKEEILATLDTRGRNRGLTFDPEMLPYCGKRCRVLRRVERTIEESSGLMIEPAGMSLILENVVCLARYRRSCPRSIYPYWREIWLRRAEPDETQENSERGMAGSPPVEPPTP